MAVLLRATFSLLLMVTGAHASEPLPTIALTFDAYKSTYKVAFPILARHGLVGTFFVEPQQFANTGVKWHHLREMKRWGWSIQAYTHDNLATYLAKHGPEAVRARFNEVKHALAAGGFEVDSLSVNQRDWNGDLRNLAVGIFKSVRSSSGHGPQSYPIPDPLNVDRGSMHSLSDADTIEMLGERLKDLVTHGGVWIVVLHGVGLSGDQRYSISPLLLEQFAVLIRRYVSQRQLRATTFEQALIPARRPVPLRILH